MVARVISPPTWISESLVVFQIPLPQMRRQSAEVKVRFVEQIVAVALKSNRLVKGLFREAVRQLLPGAIGVTGRAVRLLHTGRQREPGAIGSDRTSGWAPSCGPDFWAVPCFDKARILLLSELSFTN